MNPTIADDKMTAFSNDFNIHSKTETDVESPIDIPQLTTTTERRLMAKVDLHVLPFLFPGCFYLMSCWYTRGEAQKRFSFFFGSATLAGAFGGVLAYGIGKMN
ncbi:hypothetical protein F66182_15813, partial [Fusarium sp. NRRL 66182]